MSTSGRRYLDKQSPEIFEALTATAALFSDRERAALEIAETVTTVDGEHPGDAALARLHEDLSDTEVSVLSWAAITINAFNRVSILSGHPVLARDASGRTLRGTVAEAR